MFVCDELDPPRCDCRGSLVDGSGEHAMNVQEVLSQSRDAMTVGRVFGEPIERNGVTIVPVAKVMGGGGGGGGHSDDGQEGSGAGYGMRATPAGVYLIKGNDVEWKPSIDVNRAILGGQIIGIFFLLTLGRIIRTWMKEKG
jgi:Sporulation protein YtfJ (Spore_YtfJ)